MSEERTTHFGYEDVAVNEKASRVRGVFDSVASKYDVMNDLMSLGIHRLWKRQAIEMSGARTGQKILDLAGGTGDLSLQFAKIVGPQGRVVLSDINQSMLHKGRERLVNEGVLGNVEYVQINAEQLPFPDNHFDCITISFGLRNVTNKDAALSAIYRALKPGGRLLVLEFSKPGDERLKSAYDFYSFNILPLIGKVVANDEASYRYLAESIRMHPDQETLRGMMDEAGFDRTEFINMSGGIVALHRGFKQ
ncbi:MAG: bifunctional demethylmenaquinone methyltransferase/2-methoxy-6-polyprenyl-1,4-benzoquinol methylase UbiE [Gammaproteobacteria bacterium]|jgi:demethylmenaquinone methyltransferase / 2-methoxy-6-polyprenyl-1,4-benzoquinol methylase|nr:bifunctional demethylmenaquinone methyltransferase/2-methoxy-6-polyprenyl-1,4-benzoquinol methylase UbiE [Gammaproteobacteria bacterium]